MARAFLQRQIPAVRSIFLHKTHPKKGCVLCKKDATPIGANFNGKVFIKMVWKIFPLKTRTLALIEAASFLFFGAKAMCWFAPKNKKIQRKAGNSS